MNRNLRTLVIATTTAWLGTTAVWAANPAAGEFSAADETARPSYSVDTRSAVREQARADAGSAHRVNGEAVEAYTRAPSDLTRETVRAEGRAALRAGTLSVGDAS